MTAGEWLRKRSERYLLEAAQEDLVGRYLRRPGPPVGRGVEPWFFRSIFTPVYRRLPWRVRLGIIRTMPGSHRRGWRYPAPQRHPAV